MVESEPVASGVRWPKSNWEISVQMIPAFDMRWLNWTPDLDWADRLRLNYFPRGDKVIDLKNSKLAGTSYSVGRGSHSLGSDGLLPYAEIDKHPEYFALIKGNCLREGQPCLTNPAPIDVIVKNAKNRRHVACRTTAD